MPRNHWIVKQEPESYSWDTFVKEGRTAWTGVRNFQARNNLRGMKKGELVAYYHSGSEKQVVGLARVEREAYADPTAEEGDWSCVDLAPVKPLKKPVSLATINLTSPPIHQKAHKTEFSPFCRATSGRFREARRTSGPNPVSSVGRSIP